MHLRGSPPTSRLTRGLHNVLKEFAVMAKDAKQQSARRRRRATSQRVPLEQVSPAILTASRDVAYTLDQLDIQPQPEEVLKSVLERAEHLEEQASGLTVLDE